MLRADHRALADGVLGGRRAEAAARVRRRGAVADRPDRVEPPHPQVIVDRDPAALVERQLELAQDRLRGDAGGPDHGPGRQRLAAGEAGEVGPDLLQGRLQADVDAAPAQLAQRVLGQLQVDLRQHPVRRLDQHPAHPVQARPRVAVHRVGGEVLQLGQRLEAGVAAADEDVGEQLVAAAGVLGRVGLLQRLDQVVAEVDRVGQALEADRVLGQAGHRQRPRDRAQRQQQLVVGQRLGLAVGGRAARPSSRSGSWPTIEPSRR